MRIFIPKFSQKFELQKDTPVLVGQDYRTYKLVEYLLGPEYRDRYQEHCTFPSGSEIEFTKMDFRRNSTQYEVYGKICLPGEGGKGKRTFSFQTSREDLKRMELLPI